MDQNRHNLLKVKLVDYALGGCVPAGNTVQS